MNVLRDNIDKYIVLRIYTSVTMYNQYLLIELLSISYVSLRKQDGHEEVERNCDCISAFVRPQPFLTRIYPQLTESDNGFLDSLLVCIPKTRVLREEVR